MTGQASPVGGRDSERRTSGWQFALFIIALALFAIHVLLPLDRLALLLLVGVGVTVVSRALTGMGALAPGIFEGTLYLATALMFLGALAAGGVTAWNLLRRLGGAPWPPPLLLRRPWLLVGISMDVACWLIVPEDLGRSQHPVLAGAFVLAAATWTTFYVGYVLWKLSQGALLLSWRIARASPFGAGLLPLAVEGQNSGKVEPLLCSDEAFRDFVERHHALAEAGVVLVPEDNEDMRGSYAMVDPAERFFDNTGAGHHYSQPILLEGLDAAWSQVHFSMSRFEQRGGSYDFGGSR